MRWIPCLLMVAASAVMPIDARAIERGPLPALELTNLDGTVVTTAKPAMDGAWLILYVQGGCDPCDLILAATHQDTHPGLADRLVVVVAGAGRAELDALAARFPRLPRSAWYGDPTRNLLTRLRLPGVPAVIGLHGQMMEWSLSGVLTDAAAVESVLASWVER